MRRRKRSRNKYRRNNTNNWNMTRTATDALLGITMIGAVAGAAKNAFSH